MRYSVSCNIVIILFTQKHEIYITGVRLECHKYVCILATILIIFGNR